MGNGYRWEEVSGNETIKSLYTETAADPHSLPLIIRHSIGNLLNETDFATLPKQADKKEFIQTVFAKVREDQEAKDVWSVWSKLPFSGAQTGKCHSVATLTKLLSKCAKDEAKAVQRLKRTKGAEESREVEEAPSTTKEPNDDTSVASRAVEEGFVQDHDAFSGKAQDELPRSKQHDPEQPPAESFPTTPAPATVVEALPQNSEDAFRSMPALIPLTARSVSAILASVKRTPLVDLSSETNKKKRRNPNHQLPPSVAAIIANFSNN